MSNKKHSKKESAPIIASKAVKVGLGLALMLTGQWILRQQGKGLVEKVMKGVED